MNRFIAGCLMGSLLGSLAFAAVEPAPPQDLSHFLSDLQVKLDHTAQRVNQPTSAGSSVIGLRGTKQEPVSKQLYWKGVQGETPVNPQEVKLFRSAVEAARDGKKDDAISTLQNFQKTYPKSALLPDVTETLRRLNTPEVAVPAAAPVSAAPAPAAAAALPPTRS
jgi:hypothetical protein